MHALMLDSQFVGHRIWSEIKFISGPWSLSMDIDQHFP
jgi:hypothetical protein